MKLSTTRFVALLGGLLWTLGATVTALADDTEIFFGQATSTSAPNIMFIFDTSGSMDTQVTTTAPYNPGTTYAGTGSCSGLSGRIFYRTGNRTDAPACSGTYINDTDLKCAAASSGFASSGRYVDSLARWGQTSVSRGRGGGTPYYNWDSSSSVMTITSGGPIECRQDDGVDGNLTATNPYPRYYPSNDNTANTALAQWTSSSTASYWTGNTGTLYTLFSANYVIWQQQHQTTVLGTRMSIMKAAAVNMLNSLNGVNAGLMRYSNNGGSGCEDSAAQGGMVLYPVSPIESGRSNLIAQVNAFNGDGCTPLSETLYEGYLYYKGGAVDYGNSSSPTLSIATSRTAGGTSYESPADYACQKSFVVYLTDGLPTADTNATSKIQALGSAAGSCRANSPTDGGGTTSDGRCLAAMARYMSDVDLRDDVPGDQTVTSYFIGLGDSFSTSSGLTAAFDYLSEAAVAGGGEAYQANDLTGLSTALSEILTDINDDSGSFTAPTVAVNAFNRTRSLNELYISMFRPTNKFHWPGNVKKYKLVGNQIVDAAGDPAIDPLGGFDDGAQSIWSASPDGNVTEDGGAANKLPVPQNRNLYTWIGGTNVAGAPVDLTSGNTYKVDVANAATLEPVLGTTSTSTPSTTTLIEWARGGYGDSAGTDPTVPRYSMGDPLHSQSAVVIYGGTTTTPDVTDGLLFTATNDGYLHAVDTVSGVEQWAFIPHEGLASLPTLYEDAARATKHYLLDGDVTVLKFDTNGDGIVDPSSVNGGRDRVLLFVSQGRGGSKYYALDVTSRTAPKFLWQVGASELNGIGQSWSTPKIARVNIDGATQNSQKLVLIFGGGYDPAEDGTDISGAYVATSSVGNRMFIVDAVTGNVLWSGGPGGAGTTQEFGASTASRMVHSFPASPNVLDTDSDGYDDRIYIGDTAAQLWRFDIWNGRVATQLVTGGVVASLGNHGVTAPQPVADARRFYTTPDSARVAAPGGAVYMAVAIGSGYRGHPLNTTIQDRFYVWRDKKPFTQRTQADYDSATVVLDSNMRDITASDSALTNADPGWKLTMNQNGGWVGEKVLAGASIFGGAVIFPTYAPTSGAQPCAPATGVNRAYMVNVMNGGAVADLDTDGTIGDIEGGQIVDRSMLLTESAIAPEVRILFPGNEQGSGDNGGDDGEACAPGDPSCEDDDDDDGDGDPTCLIGSSVVPCPPANTFIKTYWREGGAP